MTQKYYTQNCRQLHSDSVITIKCLYNDQNWLLMVKYQEDRYSCVCINNQLAVRLDCSVRCVGV